jgi:hypothetical protein
LTVEGLLGNDGSKTTEKVTLTVNNNNLFLYKVSPLATHAYPHNIPFAVTEKENQKS